MRTLAWRGVRNNLGRYIATLVAIITGVGFFTATGFVSDRVISSLEGDVDRQYGNVDSRAGAEILSFMRQAVREFGQTIVMVTHDPVAASYSDRAVFLADGQIVDELDNPTSDSVFDRMRTLGA